MLKLIFFFRALRLTSYAYTIYLLIIFNKFLSSLSLNVLLLHLNYIPILFLILQHSFICISVFIAKSYSSFSCLRQNLAYQWRLLPTALLHIIFVFLQKLIIYELQMQKYALKSYNYDISSFPLSVLIVRFTFFHQVVEKMLSISIRTSGSAFSLILSFEVEVCLINKMQ